MQGLTMDYQLNVGTILRRGEELFGHKSITSRLPDKSWHTYTYAGFARRAKQLSLALRDELGLVDGDRVATFAWNHHEHLETYLGAPIGQAFAESGTTPGAIYKNVWISSRPRPQ